MPSDSPENANVGSSGPLIPPTLRHVIGQTNVVERLKVALEASFADAVPFAHTLLLGPPGLGKTTIAQVVAKELAAQFFESLGQTLTTPPLLSGFLLTASEDRAVLFIDEIHSLPPDCQLALYRAMDDRKVFIRSGQGDKTSSLSTVRFTLIGATTNAELLLPPLRDRFKIVCPLEPYHVQDLVAIMRQRIRQLGWTVADEVFGAVATRAFGTPRLALRLLESAHRTCRSQGDSAVTMAHVDRTLELEGIDELGLGPDERRYLAILCNAGGPVRLGAMASKMRLAPSTVARVIEDRLVLLDLIERHGQGRELTPKGIEHARQRPTQPAPLTPS